MKKLNGKYLSPAFLPVYFFAGVIALGGILLHLDAAGTKAPVSLLDAMFTSVSATCVTGLAVVDTGSAYSLFGQSVILVLIQIGGLGVMTYTSLVFYLWRRRITMTDRIAVGQTLLSDPGFHLGSFLKQMLLICACIEGAGAVALHVASVGEIGWFSAFFHSISAFCNAGFSLFPDSLMRYASNLPVNLIFMVLIILGGIGFYVLLELPEWAACSMRLSRGRTCLSWQTRVVIRTSMWLILIGAVLFFLIESRAQGNGAAMLQAVFQSVSARTAGFNSVDIALMSDASLFVLIVLMVIGGSPGSCAGGIKTTTLRVLMAFGVSQLKGREQLVVDGVAVDRSTVNKAMTLVIMAIVIILGAVFVLAITEGATASHREVGGKFLEVLFEAASAFGTVGLSTGITPHLSVPGKLVIMLLMFIGRLGPIVFVSMLQAWQTREYFRRPEKNLLIG